MAGGQFRLSANQVKNSKPDKGKSSKRYFDGAGLIVEVRPAAGSKNKFRRKWIFRYTSPTWQSPKGGRIREMGLGSYPNISLEKARALAQECRSQIADDIDPIENRSRQTGGQTFGDIADDLFKRLLPTWSNPKSAIQWKRTLEVTCKPIRNKMISAIDIDDVVSVLEPIWIEKPETAKRTRMRIERVLSRAIALRQRPEFNPADLRYMIERLPARSKEDDRIKHHAAMPYRDVPAFYADLMQQPSFSAMALRLTILTACRTSEVLEASWPEFDIDARLWTIPATRMKARKEHVVPLSDATIELLSPLSETRWSDWVFPGNAPRNPLSNMAMLMCMRRMGVQRYTTHGFRSSFRDWAGDKTNFPREIAEHALAHQVGDEVERAYRRSAALEKRRQLMDAWAQYCQGSAADNVVQLHG